MNKAFTKESDYDPTAELVIRPLPVLPPGVKNYITPEGAERLRAELVELRQERRPPLLAELGQRVAAGLQEEKEHRMLQTRLRQLEAQIRQLEERIGTLEIVAPRADEDDLVRFGARVTVLDSDGASTNYRIVGADETDAERGWISWATPLAKALLGAAEGDEVTVKLPRGERVLEIEAVDYTSDRADV